MFSTILIYRILGLFGNSKDLRLRIITLSFEMAYGLVELLGIHRRVVNTAQYSLRQRRINVSIFVPTSYFLLDVAKHGTCGISE